MARVVSNNVTVTVQSNALPAWLPTRGKFSDGQQPNGNVMLASAIDPDKWMEDGTPQVYAGRPFGGSQGDFDNVWKQQNGGDINYEMGQYGTFFLFGGGHFAYNGCTVITYDIGTGTWDTLTYPPYANAEKKIINGSVANLTGTVVTLPASEDNNLVVNKIGAYYKYMDYTYIPGAGTDPNGTDCPLEGPGLFPYPIHSNCGIQILPSDAGGGPKGSLLICGHDQTGLTIPSGPAHIFRLDCDTKIWSRTSLPLTMVYSTPALSYDRNRKLMWYWPAGGTWGFRPVALDYRNDYLNPAYHRPTSSTPSWSNYLTIPLYIPSRDIFISLDGQTTPFYNDGMFRVPRLLVAPLWGYQFGNSTAINFTAVTTNPTSAYYRDQICKGLDTGWPGYRAAPTQGQTDSDYWKGGSDSGNLIAGGSFGPRPSTYRGTYTANAATDELTLNGSLSGVTVGARVFFGRVNFVSQEAVGTMTGGIVEGKYYAVQSITGNVIKLRVSEGSSVTLDITSNDGGEYWIHDGKIRGAQDKLEWCEDTDSVFFIERHAGTENNVPRAQQQTLVLWHLWMPPVGQELTGTWTWEREVLTPMPNCVGAAISNLGDMPAWGGKTKYVKALKCAYYTDRDILPVQFIKSKYWPV
jgi:hypothetical protein